MHKANKAAPKKKGGSSLPHSKYSFLYVRYTIVFSDSQGKVWRFRFRVAERPSKILSVNATVRGTGSPQASLAARRSTAGKSYNCAFPLSTRIVPDLDMPTETPSGSQTRT